MTKKNNPITDFSKQDHAFMTQALRLAERGLGLVAPNPAVGCVITKENGVIARGWTQPGGRPHAEAEALKRAGANARGATCYVTLEPCAHHGETPPCAKQLAESGIARVVYAIGDPDPRVNGDGALFLDKAGIAVESGLEEHKARHINRGFFLKTTKKRPLITLKLATSENGMIAARKDRQTWITGKDSRRYAHRLRLTHDAILVGIGTVMTDDPSLTCRLPGLEKFSPKPFVLDSSLKTPEKSKLVQNAGNRSIGLITNRETKTPEDLKKPGIDIIRVKNTRDLDEVLAKLAETGITRLLVEGGGKVNASFLKSGRVDDIVWFQAPIALKNSGVPAFADMVVKNPADLKGFRKLGDRPIGKDRVEFFTAMD